MYYSTEFNNEITVIAGDDLCIAVDLSFDNDKTVFDFADGAKAVMLLHHNGMTEEIQAAEYDRNVAKFLLPGEETKRLSEMHNIYNFCFCIKVILPNGICNTPVYRHPLNIKRC